MPIPKPKLNQDRAEFIAQCMIDELMVSEYPDIQQRYAVCIAQIKSND